jgi:hypothetical protein
VETCGRAGKKGEQTLQNIVRRCLQFVGDATITAADARIHVMLVAARLVYARCILQLLLLST